MTKYVFDGQTVRLKCFNLPLHRHLSGRLQVPAVPAHTLHFSFTTISSFTMSAEARSLLDALMGPDRDAPLPPGTATARRDQWNSSQRRGNKKSCYDRDICPLYCAWGVDVYELFTNTKSDLGPNPNVVQEDARDEYVSLPEHEKNRLGYELMLYRKLADLVRNCDRVVARNKEKLRAEIAKNAKARGAGPSVTSIDPVTAVKDEMLVEAAECIAEIEMSETQVESFVHQLSKLETHEKDLYLKLCELRKQSELHNKDDSETYAKSDENNGEPFEKEKEEAGEDYKGDHFIVNSAQSESSEDKLSKIDLQKLSLEISERETELFGLFSIKQEILSSIASLTCNKLVPLRETLFNLQKQLHYVRSDTASDKSVCEISGNFMSSRDADERIAAHYAGKQYVGWKMVREKLRELQKKYPGGYSQSVRNVPASSSYGGNWANPPAGYEQHQQRGPPPMMDRDNWQRGPPFAPGRNSGNRRGPSPDRWERDRAINGDDRRSYGYRSNR